MTSERATCANRSNAKASTGPRTRVGKVRSGQNARKHGLSAAGSSPEVDAEVARLVNLIMGEYGGGEATREAARSLAEAQMQVLSVRAFKVSFLSKATLARWFDVKTGRDPSAVIPLEGILTLESLERYERRAYSRRKSALMCLIDHVNRAELSAK